MCQAKNCPCLWTSRLLGNGRRCLFSPIHGWEKIYWLIVWDHLLGSWQSHHRKRQSAWFWNLNHSRDSKVLIVFVVDFTTLRCCIILWIKNSDSVSLFLWWVRRLYSDVFLMPRNRLCKWNVSFLFPKNYVLRWAGYNFTIILQIFQ